jgi:Arc/MetJ-type ribon-helix-helix transcriptional regulator
VRTISFKLPDALDDALAELARRRGMSKSAVVREGLEALTGAKRRSVTGAAGELVGCLDGPPDLSTAETHLDGYGE